MANSDNLTLYECRGCGIVSTSKMGGCPACGKTEGPTKHVHGFDGDTREVQRNWYKEHHVPRSSIPYHDNGHE